MSIMCKTEELLEKVTKSLGTWKKLITDMCDGSENEFNLLKQQVEAYSKLEQQFDNTNNALQLVDEKLNSSIKCEDVDALYQECYESLATSSTVNHHDSKVWQAIFEVNYRGSDVREIHIKKKKLGNNQYEELDESLMCANVFSPPIDPISKVVIKNPFRNKRCGHAYEYDTIVDYIKHMKHKAKCPYIGCNSSVLRMTDLVQDGMLMSQISQYLETHVSENEEEDD